MQGISLSDFFPHIPPTTIVHIIGLHLLGRYPLIDPSPYILPHWVRHISSIIPLNG